MAEIAKPDPTPVICPKCEAFFAVLVLKGAHPSRTWYLLDRESVDYPKFCPFCGAEVMKPVVTDECPETGKVCYKTRIRAIQALAKLKDKNPMDAHIPIRAYKCPFCGLHHLTSQEDRLCRQDQKSAPKEESPRSRKN
jgi:hypothetical protein